MGWYRDAVGDGAQWPDEMWTLSFRGPGQDAVAAVASSSRANWFLLLGVKRGSSGELVGSGSVLSWVLAMGTVSRREELDNANFVYITLSLSAHHLYLCFLPSLCHSMCTVNTYLLTDG